MAGLVEIPPASVPPKRSKRYVQFINHATVLVQVDNVNILTDPIWAERASPVSFAGPARHKPPGIAFENLPKIDAVVISHNHYDHMDAETLLRLQCSVIDR
ncbi:MAG: MBL fold metallo-hydrolase [bacterium]